MFLRITTVLLVVTVVPLLILTIILSSSSRQKSQQVFSIGERFHDETYLTWRDAIGGILCTRHPPDRKAPESRIRHSRRIWRRDQFSYNHHQWHRNRTHHPHRDTRPDCCWSPALSILNLFLSHWSKISF